jgi:hypothetical protein
MLRLIFQLLVAYVLFKLARKVFLFLVKPPSETHNKAPAPETTVLTSCPRCGTFFQETQGVTGARGELFCSAACRDKK